MGYEAGRGLVRAGRGLVRAGARFRPAPYTGGGKRGRRREVAPGGMPVSRPVVGLVRWDDAGDSVRRVIELCDGLAGFHSGDRILIKPNLVFWDFDLPFPPYGVVTTTAVVSALVRLLR